MKLRIMETEDCRFLVKVELSIPDGIKFYQEEFIELTEYVVQNTFDDILFYPKDWIFKYNLQLDYIFINIATKEIIIPNPISSVKILKNLLVDEYPVFVYEIKAEQNPFINEGP